jgi:hypothetical protein
VLDVTPLRQMIAATRDATCGTIPHSMVHPLNYARAVPRPHYVLARCAIAVFTVYLIITALVAVVLFDGWNRGGTHRSGTPQSPLVQIALACQESPASLRYGLLAATYAFGLSAALLLKAGSRMAAAATAVYASATLLCVLGDGVTYAFLVIESPIVFGCSIIVYMLDWDWGLWFPLAYGPHLLFPIARFGRLKRPAGGRRTPANRA